MSNKLFIIFLATMCTHAHAVNQAEQEFYDPYLNGLKQALINQHDWFSHESLPASINIRVTNVPNRTTKPCTKKGTLHQQAVSNLDEICRLAAFQYWIETAVPRMRQIANTRQNFTSITYKDELSYQHLPEIGTSFRRRLMLPSKTVNPDSIEFRCIWALDAMMPNQQNPFLDMGRPLSWFDSPQNTGKSYYIEQCREVVLNFASRIENISKDEIEKIESTRLLSFQTIAQLEKQHSERINLAWKPVVDLISQEKNKRLSNDDIQQVSSYIIQEKRHVDLDQARCQDVNAEYVRCSGIEEFTNFRIRSLSTPVDKISLKGLKLGMTAQEFYDVLMCTDTKRDLAFMPFSAAFTHMNTVGHENSNIRVLGDLFMSCNFHDFHLAGSRITKPVAIFNAENKLEFLAFTLFSPSTSNTKERAFYKVTEALKKKYPNRVADSNGFPFAEGDLEARVRDLEGGHLTVFNEYEPIVTLVSEELIASQPSKIKKLLEARIAKFKDYRDEL